MPQNLLIRSNTKILERFLSLKSFLNINLDATCNRSHQIKTWHYSLLIKSLSRQIKIWNETRTYKSVQKSIMHIFNRVFERAKLLSGATCPPYFKCVWDIVRVLSMHRRSDFDDLYLIIALVNVLFTVRSITSPGPLIF